MQFWEIDIFKKLPVLWNIKANNVYVSYTRLLHGVSYTVILMIKKLILTDNEKILMSLEHGAGIAL